MIKDEIITFGYYSWQVIEVKEDKALIITEDIAIPMYNIPIEI